MTPHRTPMIRCTGPPSTNLTELKSHLLTPDHSQHSPLSSLHLPLITHSRLPLLIPQTQSLTPSVASKEAPHSPYRLLIAHLINAPCSSYRFYITDPTDSPKFSTQTAYYFPYCLPSFTHKPLCRSMHHLTDSREAPLLTPQSTTTEQRSHVLTPP